MHIPDGYLSLPWIIGTYAVTIAYGVYAVRKAKRMWGPATAAAVTVLAAAIFAAQMLNWPIPGGTSLHFVGGALAAILLGPWLEFVVMTLVLTTQCFVFHDGGITTLGANILNMGIIDGLVGYGVYKLVTRLLGNTRKAKIIGAFLGGWLGITIAGIAAGIEIGLSPNFPYGVEITVPVMGFWHALLGLIEGAITAIVVDYVSRRAPSWFYEERLARARMVAAPAEVRA